MRLEGKVALITGAAAGVEGELMGFGGAAARLFAQEGAKVVLTDIKEEMGQRTAAQINEMGADALFKHLDVTDEQNWIDVIRSSVAAYGKLDVLVNNAGISLQTAVEVTTVEEWDREMDVHAKGMFLGIKHAISEMRRAGGGSIINISSIDGFVGSRSSAGYPAAKGAIRSFSKTAAIQLAKDNIRVNSVYPGYAHTPLSDEGYTNDPGRTERNIERTPLGRLGNAYDIAYGILYLASDESSFVTGTELVIDGGMIAQ